jgi:hypothetical protein
MFRPDPNGELRHDAFRLRHDHLCRDALRRADERLPSRAKPALERRRERAVRAVRRTLPFHVGKLAADPRPSLLAVLHRVVTCRSACRWCSTPLAPSGQTVCRDGRTITVDDITVGEALEHDRLGRALPDWQGCRALGPGEVFFMNLTPPDSFARGELAMPRPSSQSVAIQPSGAWVPSFLPAIATHPARRSGSHHARHFRNHLHVVVMVVLFAACGIASAQPVAAAQSTVTSKSDRIERFVAEAALRFGIPTSGSPLSCRRKVAASCAPSHRKVPSA